MKTVGRRMALLMGTTMSFCLSLVGNLTSGRFTLPGFLVSFGISWVISMVIGLLVPMGPLTAFLDRRLGLRPGRLGTRCFNALVSDLLYTPVITTVMIVMAHRQATAHGAQIPFLPMWGRGLLISMVVGFALAFLLTPVYMRIAAGKDAR